MPSETAHLRLMHGILQSDVPRTVHIKVTNSFSIVRSRNSMNQFERVASK